MQFQNFKCSLLAFKVIENLEIWAWSATNVVGTSYHWCHPITDVNDTYTNSQMNPQNFKTSYWKTSGWYYMLNCSRKIETFWNSLFNVQSIGCRCIQDIEIKFASTIDIKETYLIIQLPIRMPKSSLIRVFQIAVRGMEEIRNFAGAGFFEEEWFWLF